VTPKVQHCREELNSQELRNALYGLRAMGDSPETRQLLAVLTPIVERCRQESVLQILDHELCSLRSMSDSPEARELLAALTYKAQCPKLNQQAVRNPWYQAASSGVKPDA
jgi:hypothetical protein